MIYGSEAEYTARRRKLVLARLEQDRWNKEPLRQTMTRYLDGLEASQSRLREAIEWAHGFMSNTDKAAADRLMEKAGINTYGEKWTKP